MIKNSINTLIFALLVYFCITLILSMIENTIFWAIVSELREKTGGTSSLEVARNNSVATDSVVLICHFTFMLISYRASAIIVVSGLKKKFLLHLIILVAATQSVRQLFIFYNNPQDLIDYKWLTVSEILWAFLVCIIVGITTQKLRKKRISNCSTGPANSAVL